MTDAIRIWIAVRREHGYFACRFCTTRRLYQTHAALEEHEASAHQDVRGDV